MVSLVEAMTGDFPARPVLVLSNNPDAGGLSKASDRQIAAAVVDHRPFLGNRAAFEKELNAVLDQHQPDIICLAGFMRVLTPGFATRWQGQMLNIHPSLLPKYPGLNTYARALEAGDLEAGCSVHEVIPELDAGPLLGQARVPIKSEDTVESLAKRVLVQEHILYPAVLRSFAIGDRSPVLIP